MEKDTVLVIKGHCFYPLCNSCREDKTFHQKHESYILELALIKLSWLDKY